MNSVGPGGERDVGAGVDQEASLHSPVLRSQLPDEMHGFASEGFQIARGQIFFAELNVVHTRMGGFRDLVEESFATSGFVPGECTAVGDVVEKKACSHRLSV